MSKMYIPYFKKGKYLGGKILTSSEASFFLNIILFENNDLQC